VALMLKMAKIMKSSNKFPGIKQTQFMGISKMILDEAKRKNNATTLTKEVEDDALAMANNADKFVEEYKKNPPKPKTKSVPATAIASTTTNTNFRNTQPMNDFKSSRSTEDTNRDWDNDETLGTANERWSNDRWINNQSNDNSLNN